MKVKVFKFRVCDYAHPVESENYNHEKEIEDTLNDFLTNKELVSIQVTPVDVHYHNNGRCNTIELYYTITYY